MSGMGKRDCAMHADESTNISLFLSQRRYPLSSPFFGFSARLLWPASMQVSKTEILNSVHTVYIQSVKCIVQLATGRSSCTSIDISVRQDTSFQARKHYKKSKILCRYTLSSFCGSVLSSCSSMRRFGGILQWWLMF